MKYAAEKSVSNVCCFTLHDHWRALLHTQTVGVCDFIEHVHIQVGVKFGVFPINHIMTFCLTSYPKAFSVQQCNLFQLLPLTAFFCVKCKRCATTWLRLTLKWKILLVRLALRLRILGQTVLLTFSLRVCCIAVAFRGRAMWIFLAHSFEKKKEDKSKYCFCDKIQFDRLGGKKWICYFILVINTSLGYLRKWFKFH